MSLKNYSREELGHMAMIDLTHLVLLDEMKATSFYDILDKVADLKGLTEEQKQDMIGQFYTDLTVDGQIISVDGGKWGMKRWYPVDQLDLETSVPKKKKKAKKSSKKKEGKKETKKKEPEEEEEEIPEDNIEVLTGKFEDEETDEQDDGFDDESFDDEDDEFDDEDFGEEEEEEDDDEEETKKKK